MKQAQGRTGPAEYREIPVEPFDRKRHAKFSKHTAKFPYTLTFMQTAREKDLLYKINNEIYS